jgi:hypothetical protein
MKAETKNLLDGKINYKKNNKKIILPYNFKQQEEFIKKNKLMLISSVVDSIDFAEKNNLDLVEVFGFENSKFTISLFSKEFKKTLEDIYNYYIENEFYEYCTKLKDVEKRINKNKKYIN